MWGPVFKLTKTESERCQTLELIHTVTLKAACIWEFRFASLLDSYHLSLLKIVEVEWNIEDETRVKVGRAILEASDATLNNDPFSDVALKVKHEFFEELTSLVANRGVCPPELFAFCLVFRSRVSGQTQDVEGFNSILSNLSRRMPRLGPAAASAKLSLRKGPSISPQQCVALNTEVEVFMESEENLNLFLQILLNLGI